MKREDREEARLPEVEKKVLVLDDEPDARALVGMVLGPGGFETFGTGDGEEALRLVRERNIAVALVDLLMPGMSGTRFLSELAGLPAEERPVVIVCSARRREEIERDIEGLDSFDVLTKPFELHDMERRVERAWMEKVRQLRT